MFGPNREFQAGLNQLEARRKREHDRLNLRRRDRDSRLENKWKEINENKSASNNILIHVPNIDFSNSANLLSKIESIALKLKWGDFVLQNISCQLLPFCIKLLLHHQSNEIKLPAIGIIQYIYSASSNDQSSHHDKTIIENVLKLIKICKTSKYKIKQIAVQTLGIILNECNSPSNIKKNIIYCLLDICKHPFDKDLGHFHEKYSASPMEEYAKLTQTVTDVLLDFCNMFCRKYKNINVEYKLLIIQCIFYLMKYKNKLKNSHEKYINVLIGRIIESLTIYETFEYPNPLLDYMIKSNILRDLILLFNKSPMEYEPILKCIGNILSADTKNKYIETLFDYDICKLFKIKFTQVKNNKDSESINIMKEILFCISNINGCMEMGILRVVINANIFPILCEALLKQSKIANESLFAIANVIKTVNRYRNTQVLYNLCMRCNLMEYLCKYNKLTFSSDIFNKQQQKLLDSSLEIIERILMEGPKYIKLFEENAGVNQLEMLMACDKLSEKSSDRINNILQKYFEVNINNNNYIIDNHDNDITMIGQQMMACNTFEF